MHPHNHPNPCRPCLAGLQGLDVAAYGDSILMTLLGDPLTGGPLLGWGASKAAWDRAYGGRRWAGWAACLPACLADARAAGRSCDAAPTPASPLAGHA